MDFSEACDFLFSCANYEAQPAHVYNRKAFSLSRVHQLLFRLGDPHTDYPSIHIAGTKGKGSVAAMAESVLRAANYRAGLYTSPHLCDLRERFRVGEETISEAAFAEIVTMVSTHVEEIGEITFFEVATVVAFEWFSRRQVDIAVLEVGLGGRLDATNVVRPAVCAITSISLDHVKLLGDSIASIAIEKGGIIKEGVPIICAPQHPEALTELEDIATARKAPFRLVSRDWRVSRLPSRHQGEFFVISPTEKPHAQAEYSVPLYGAHQVENAAVAVAITDELSKQGWSVGTDAVRKGLEQVNWPARCQIVPGDPTIVLDCAHNAASAASLVAMLDDQFPGQPPMIVFGCMRDKDISGVLSELLPIALQVITTPVQHPRASEPDLLAAWVTDKGVKVNSASTLSEALDQAMYAARRSSGLVLVTGSVSLAGEAQRMLRLSGHLSD